MNCDFSGILHHYIGPFILEGPFLCMPAFTYILYSPSKNRYYIGATNSLADRLNRHNSGYSKSTKSGRPWVLVYTHQFVSFQEATAFESDLKKQKKRAAYIPLIQEYTCNPFPLP